MIKRITGIHHVTAIAEDPQSIIDFYAGILGLRLVKQTVNFDDPGIYHLYYGTGEGLPGTLLTFFPIVGAPKGRHGTGQVPAISFSVPPRSLEFWMQRFKKVGLTSKEPVKRFDEQVLSLLDRDGLIIELVTGVTPDARSPWKEGPIPSDYAIQGIYNVSLSVEGYERTSALLSETLTFRFVKNEGTRFRFEIEEGGPGAIVDVLCHPEVPRGIVAAGTFHHVAFRTPDEEHQKAWRREITRAGLNATPILDRQYFRSIYFREPGSVLLELATEGPGCLTDEKYDDLGAWLMLPPWLEPRRSEIQKSLPPLRLLSSDTFR
ncbi:MAG: ring-cleaving dioxygenase [bacterium]